MGEGRREEIVKEMMHCSPSISCARSRLSHNIHLNNVTKTTFALLQILQHHSHLKINLCSVGIGIGKEGWEEGMGKEMMHCSIIISIIITAASPSHHISPYNRIVSYQLEVTTVAKGIDMSNYFSASITAPRMRRLTKRT